MEREGTRQEKVGTQRTGERRVSRNVGGSVILRPRAREKPFFFFFSLGFCTLMLPGEFKSVLVERKGQKPHCSWLRNKQEVKK